MSAQHIAEHFRLIFSEYGWPDMLVSDNGLCYVAETFTSLMKRICSSPHYQFPTLPPIQWTSREICPNHKDSLPQSKS